MAFDFTCVPEKVRTKLIDDTEAIAANYKFLQRKSIELVAEIAFKLAFWRSKMKETTYTEWFEANVGQYFSIRTASRYIRIHEIYGSDLTAMAKMPVDITTLGILAENTHETAGEARATAAMEYENGKRVNPARAKAIIQAAIAKSPEAVSDGSQNETVSATAKEIRAPESDSNASDDSDAPAVDEAAESEPGDAPEVSVGAVDVEEAPLTQEDADRDIACLVEQYGLGVIANAVLGHPVLGPMMTAQLKKRTEKPPGKPKPAKKPVKNNKGRPASLQVVIDFCTENGLIAIDPEAWWDHYQANGWKVGRNAMKDWRASARNWNRKQLAATPGRQREDVDFERKRAHAAQATDYVAPKPRETPAQRRARCIAQRTQHTIAQDRADGRLPS